MTESRLITFRDNLLRTVPRWLRKGAAGPGIAGRVMYAMGVQVDGVAAALVEGTKRRFPGLDGQYDTLPLIGAERRIARGPYETDQGYAARLIPWLDDHATRGGPYAMLAQLHGFWSGAFEIALVYRTGKRFSLHTDGTITRDFISPWASYGTNADGKQLCKWKLFFAWPGPLSNDGLWGSLGSSGDGHWGDGGIWGSSLTPTQVQNILLVPTEWNCAHAHGSVSLLPPTVWADTSHWQDPGLVCLSIY